MCSFVRFMAGTRAAPIMVSAGVGETLEEIENADGCSGVEAEPPSGFNRKIRMNGVPGPSY